jgi:hypothetical protein
MDEDLSKGRTLRVPAYVVGAFLVLGAVAAVSVQILSP